MLKKFQNFKLNENWWYNNLDEPNSYYEVSEPFELFILQGHEDSNTYYGSSMIMKPIWKKITTQPGDIIENLHGGLFWRQPGSKRQTCKMYEPEFSPLEKKSRGRDILPLDKLEKIEVN